MEKEEVRPIPRFWLRIPYEGFENAILKVVKVGKDEYKLIKLGTRNENDKVRVMAGKYLNVRNLFDSDKKIAKMKKINENEILVRLVNP